MSAGRSGSPPVVLASASPRRRELLRALVPAFDAREPNVEEVLGHDPIADARRLALAKAAVVAAGLPDAVVLGADTVVHDGRRHYGKPASPDEAAAMLRALRGRPHTVVTAAAVVHAGEVWVGHSEARVWLAELDDAAIAAYVASGRPMDKAGAYAIQDEDVPTVARLEGCYCAVVGLPLWVAWRGLRALGLPAEAPSAAYPRCEACPDRNGP
ncbi:Septum formation protein Maf [bacterium HR29]|nr:Septum formation protein Maf [bacterium HR29]